MQCVLWFAMRMCVGLDGCDRITRGRWGRAFGFQRFRDEFCLVCGAHLCSNAIQTCWIHLPVCTELISALVTSQEEAEAAASSLVHFDHSFKAVLESSSAGLINPELETVEHADVTLTFKQDVFEVTNTDPKTFQVVCILNLPYQDVSVPARFCLFAMCHPWPQHMTTENARSCAVANR